MTLHSRNSADGHAQSGEQHKTAVLLCGQLERLGQGLELGEIGRFFREADSAVQVEVFPDLCRHPNDLPKAVAQAAAKRCVIGLCARDHSGLEMQSRVKKAGLDPIGLETVNLGAHCARVHPRLQGTEKAKVLLAAAVARARAFGGSAPETLKPFFSCQEEISRRALFTLPPLGYRSVPTIVEERCTNWGRCQICVRACPLGALARTRGQVYLDKARCEACGVCVTACPRAAIEFPGYSLTQLEAQMTTLLAPALASLEPRGLLFTCQRNAPLLEALGTTGLSYSAGWLPIQVPCLGMVSATWALQALALGAGAIALLPCDAECSLEQWDAIKGRMEYCQELLRLLGDTSERVKLLSPLEPSLLAQALSVPPAQRDTPPGGERLCRASLSRPEAAAQGLQSLATVSGRHQVSFEHPHSSLGLVELRAAKCVGCGVCAEACPTGAMTFQQGDDSVSLSYDAALCLGCGECVAECPETALLIRRATDLAALYQGRVTLYQDEETRCQVCSAPIAPYALLRRIEAVLGWEGATSSAVITHYCPSCRAASVGEKRMPPQSVELAGMRNLTWS